MMCAATEDIDEELESMPALIVSYQGFVADTSVGSCQHAIRPRSREASVRFSAHADYSVYIAKHVYHDLHMNAAMCVCAFSQ